VELVFSFFLPPSLNFPPGRLTNVRIALLLWWDEGKKRKKKRPWGEKREGGNGKQTNSRVMRESDEGLWKRKKQLDSNSFSNEGWKNIHTQIQGRLCGSRHLAARLLAKTFHGGELVRNI
jgi:hypothetical protein